VIETPWVVGTRPARPLAEGLGVELHELPPVVLDPEWSGAHRIEEWQEGERTAPAVERAVVAVWPEVREPCSVVDLDLVAWTARMETVFALWFAALAATGARCAPGGRVVAVVDRPGAKDSAGWALESATADAVEVMVRSLAQVHQDRGIRLHLVTTSARLSGAPPAALAEVVGAVGMLLSAGSTGVATAVIRAGSGW
jgi:hypothetical protein